MPLSGGSSTPLIRVHGFVDGAHLWVLYDGQPAATPFDVVRISHKRSGAWSCSGGRVTRVTYYDARPDAEEEAPPERRSYWEEVERQPHTHLGFGALRGRARRQRGDPRQKEVDTLLAVHLLSGAFRNLYDVAVLVTADDDFIPVVHEVQRQGKTVLVAGGSKASDRLRAAADLFVSLEEVLGLPD